MTQRGNRVRTWGDEETGPGRKQRREHLELQRAASSAVSSKFLPLQSPGLWGSLQQPRGTNTRPLSAPPAPALATWQPLRKQQLLSASFLHTY